jgi:hypothetical protein
LTKRRCTATTKKGDPCQAWAVHGSNPPRCAAHGGGSAPVGAPQNNDNAKTHGFYATRPQDPPRTIDEVFADLAEKQAALSAYIDSLLYDEDADLEDIARVLKIHGMNASRLGRLLRDRRALSGKAADGIAGAVAQALDELSTELNVDL